VKGLFAKIRKQARGGRGGCMLWTGRKAIRTGALHHQSGNNKPPDRMCNPVGGCQVGRAYSVMAFAGSVLELFCPVGSVPSSALPGSVIPPAAGSFSPFPGPLSCVVMFCSGLPPSMPLPSAFPSAQAAIPNTSNTHMTADRRRLTTFFVVIVISPF
jgi:hypothetical protein